MNANKILIIGDVLTIIIVMAIGFAMHGETSLSFLPRFMIVCLALAIAWFLLGPWFGLFQREITANLQQLWRVVLAVFFVGPTAAFIRGLILSAPIAPIFIVVLIFTLSLGMLLWRGIYCFLPR